MWNFNHVVFLATLVAAGAYEYPGIVKDLNLIEVPFKSLPTPEDLVFRLSEEEYEDYLDFWLHKQTEERLQDLTEGTAERASCSVAVSSLSEPQPIYASSGSLLTPTGKTGSIAFSDGETVTMACPGSGLTQSSTSAKPVEAALKCTGGTSFSSAGWLASTASFSSVGCSSHPPSAETRAGSCVDGGTLINIGLTAGGKTHTLITSCFHEAKAEVFYVVYDQTPENFVYMSGVARPSFSQGAFYPGLSVDNLYTQNSQKSAMDSILGPGMSSGYVNATYFLARGHLAAKTDYVFSPAQRATFTFINCAPQWQPFNGGNWNTFEQNLRTRIGNAGARTKIYTGTHGILQLKNSAGSLKSIYLSPSNNKLPVPLWFYKVVHEPSTNKATAFLGLNNPHVTLAEAKALAFCTDRCGGNSAFDWINWKADNIGMGYSLCCDVSDFRNTVTQLPSFTSNALFT